MTERIFLRSVMRETCQLAMEETEAILAFKINGFRFMYHDGRITDALTGCYVSDMYNSITLWAQPRSKTVQEFIQWTEAKVIENYDRFIEKAKEVMKNKRGQFRNGRGKLP